MLSLWLLSDLYPSRGLPFKLTFVTPYFYLKTYSFLRRSTKVQLVLSPMTGVDATSCHNVRLNL